MAYENRWLAARALSPCRFRRNSSTHPTMGAFTSHPISCDLPCAVGALRGSTLCSGITPRPRSRRLVTSIILFGDMIL